MSHTEDAITVGGGTFRALAERDPAALPWAALGADVVVESTGIFTKAAAARKHVNAGAKKVVISAPATDEDITVVMGINDGDYPGARTPSSPTRRAPRTASPRWPRCCSTRSASSRAS